MPFESDATKGAAAQSLAERAVSVVDHRTRSQTLVDKASIGVTLRGLHVRDADTSPSQAIRMAVRAGDLVALMPPGAEREYLGLPDSEVFRAAFDNPSAEEVREKYLEECEHRARPQYVGALYELVEDLQE